MYIGRQYPGIEEIAIIRYLKCNGAIEGERCITKAERQKGLNKRIAQMASLIPTRRFLGNLKSLSF